MRRGSEQAGERAQRVCHAGTTDEAWQRDRAPALPRHFDYRFFNCAHPDLVTSPWLAGDETVMLLNLNREASRLGFA